MSKSGMVPAIDLGPLDRIEVPVEVCEVVSIVRVPGQLKNRKNSLLQLKVRPVSGPWAECEGTFVIESSDLIPLIKKHTIKEKRKAARREFFNKLWCRVFGPKVEPLAITDKKVVPQWT